MNFDFNLSRRRRSWDEREQKLMLHQTWANVAGAAISVGGAILSKPKASAPGQAPTVDLNAEAQKAIAGNASNETSIEDLLTRANSYTQGQANSLMEQALPGFSNLQKQFTQTASNELAHPYDVPKDVQDNIARIAAERGISAGTRGQFSDFSLLRDFGVNELQYGQSQINQASSITSMIASLTPRVNPLSPMSMYVTPAQSAQVATSNQSANQASLNANAAASNYNNAANASMWGGVTAAAGKLAGQIDWSSLGKTGTNKIDNSNTGGVPGE